MRLSQVYPHSKATLHSKNVKNVILFPISWLYSGALWKMHLIEYKQARYWFSKSWDMFFHLLICCWNVCIIDEIVMGTMTKFTRTQRLLFTQKNVKNVIKIVEFHGYILVRHEKCIWLSTNKPGILRWVRP